MNSTVLASITPAEGACKELREILDTQSKKLLPPHTVSKGETLSYSLRKVSGKKHDSLVVSSAGELVCLDFWVAGKHEITGPVIYSDKDEVTGQVSQVFQFTLLFDDPVQATLFDGRDMFGRQNIKFRFMIKKDTVAHALAVIETVMASVG